jgi:hypothetical protein
MLSIEPTILNYIALALAAIFALPTFGRRVLAFRDLQDYRAEKPK